MKKKSDYVPAPTVDEQLVERYRAVLLVLAGQLTVKAAAKKVGLSRNRFQTLMHRGLAALVAELEAKTPGPAAMSEAERALREENEQLRRHVQKLESRVQTVDRMLGIASEMVRGQVRLTGRGPARERRAKTTTPAADDEKEEPDVAVARVAELRRLGVHAECASWLAGRSGSTLRRWTRRVRRGEPALQRPGPATRESLPGELAARLDELVRATHGLIGADALRHAVPGTTRRTCAAVKRTTLREVERERLVSTQRVEVAKPGVVRGFDQMHVRTRDGVRWLLFSADGAVQYRTSVAVAERYDAEAVAEAVERDFAEHGAPLVWRVDRARQHEEPGVLAVLARYEVLLLHGPPRHPQYYGQLERQNREHRAWLDALGLVHANELAEHVARMLAALNGSWPRRTLDWKTAAQKWNARQPVDVDRPALREEVRETAAKLRRDKNITDDRAERFAIEAALTNRELLRRSAGQRC